LMVGLVRLSNCHVFVSSLLCVPLGKRVRGGSFTLHTTLPRWRKGTISSNRGKVDLVERGARRSREPRRGPPAEAEGERGPGDAGRGGGGRSGGFLAPI
jgi:hypothetical protein